MFCGDNQLLPLKYGSLKLLEPSGPVEACNEIALPFHLYIYSFHALYLRLIRAVSLSRSAQEGSISGQTLRPQCSDWSNLQTLTLRLENVCVSNLFCSAAVINTLLDCNCFGLQKSEQQT
jgi:hypothetical protein